MFRLLQLHLRKFQKFAIYPLPSNCSVWWDGSHTMCAARAYFGLDLPKIPLFKWQRFSFKFFYIEKRCRTKNSQKKKKKKKRTPKNSTPRRRLLRRGPPCAPEHASHVRSSLSLLLTLLPPLSTFPSLETWLVACTINSHVAQRTPSSPRTRIFCALLFTVKQPTILLAYSKYGLRWGIQEWNKVYIMILY
jgi:hypothetical protein